MTKPLRVTINGATFEMPIGEVLLDSALVNGVEVPHDCRSGQCGSCLVRVEAGRTIGGDTAEPGMVRACQARVLTDLDVRFRQPMPIQTVDGEIARLRELGSEAVEVVICLDRPLGMRPGQHCHVTFKGYPARTYSPTLALDGDDEPQTLRLHVRRLPQGRVSAHLGESIRPGHRVRLEGPFGTACFQEGESSRLVLFASGTGFAPIWAIADSALREWPSRQMVIVVGTRTLEAFYMGQALSRVAHHCRQVDIFAMTRVPQSKFAWIGQGRPDDLSYLIEPGDIVHAAGGPDMVAALETAAATVGARFLADAFHPSDSTRAGWRLPSLAALAGGLRPPRKAASLMARLQGAG